MHTYSLSISSAGYIKKHEDDKYGWQLEDLGATHPENLGTGAHRFLVVVNGGEVYVGADLLDLLGCPARFYASKSMKLSTGRKLWAVNKDALDRMEEAIDYPTRSQREEMVRWRNNGIWSFLETIWIGLQTNHWAKKLQRTCRVRKSVTIGFEDGVTYRVQKAGDEYLVTHINTICPPTIHFPAAEFPCLFERSKVIYFE